MTDAPKQTLAKSEYSSAALQAMRGTGARTRLKTHGISMRPLIEAGSTVEIHFVPPEKVEPGDIILFDQGRGLVLHRVIQRAGSPGEPGFIEKGDHQPFTSLVTYPEYLGRLARVEREGSVFDMYAPRGRRITRRLLLLARLEVRLYKWKQQRLGNRPIWISRYYQAASRRLRGLLGGLPGRKKTRRSIPISKQ